MVNLTESNQERGPSGQFKEKTDLSIKTDNGLMFASKAVMAVRMVRHCRKLEGKLGRKSAKLNNVTEKLKATTDPQVEAALKLEARLLTLHIKSLNEQIDISKKQAMAWRKRAREEGYRVNNRAQIKEVR